jgi:hypothetical protein
MDNPPSTTCPSHYITNPAHTSRTTSSDWEVYCGGSDCTSAPVWDWEVYCSGSVCTSAAVRLTAGGVAPLLLRMSPRGADGWTCLGNPEGTGGTGDRDRASSRFCSMSTCKHRESEGGQCGRMGLKMLWYRMVRAEAVEVGRGNESKRGLVRDAEGGDGGDDKLAAGGDGGDDKWLRVGTGKMILMAAGGDEGDDKMVWKNG